MKKKFLIATCVLMCANVLMAQPQPPTKPTNAATQGIRRSNVPVAPATLLLLGLGGATVGTMVFRNSKNKKEE
ncbi:MAG: PEP-CTERM sorting domain-containing protein [Bacteroidales bacterium]|jgi:hypothetical protein|nr:PEP-CTERM sorting domain-containing protein [Bacteroidales bacterium]